MRTEQHTRNETRLGRLARTATGCAIAAALAGIAAPAHAIPTLANPVLIAQAGETVICIATNVSKVERTIEMSLTNGTGTAVAAEEKTIEPFKSAAISFVNSGNFPGFYVCEIDLNGAARRSFRARIRSTTDAQVLN